MQYKYLYPKPNWELHLMVAPPDVNRRQINTAKCITDETPLTRIGQLSSI